MSEKHLFILLFLLFFNSMVAAELDCSSSFERQKEIACSSLSNSEQYCRLVDNECRDWYQNCEDYHPTSNFDDAICQKIIPSTLNKKCSVTNVGGSKTCEMVEQACEDSSDLICTGITLESGKRCIFKGEGEKCEEHSDSCSGLTQVNCEKNIPLDETKKCSWDGSSCNEITRKCNEYKLYKDSKINSYEVLCSKLESEASKTCIFIDNECKEVYESCESINNEVECTKSKPLKNGKLPYDPLKKCEWEETQCSTKNRKCSDYKTEEDTEICGQLSSESANKKCSFNTEKNICEEVYNDCYSYNTEKTSEQRRADECEAIDTGSSNYKCKLVDDTCQQIEIKCEDFDEEESCFKYQPLGTSNKCIFKGGSCIQEPKTCNNFDYSVVADSDTNKNKCESITGFNKDYEGEFFGKCSYDPKTYRYCNFESYFNCDEYKGVNEYICSLYKAEPYSKCVIKNNKCISEKNKPLSCDEYMRQAEYFHDTLTKEGCESVKLSIVNEKCVFYEEINKCSSVIQSCSSYTGNDPKICRLFSGSAKDKSCGIVEGKCVEINNYIYNYCYEYRGKDKEICEGIQPKIGNSYELSQKCVFKEFFCDTVNKECSDAKSEIECSQLTPTDENKICIFKGNSCVEQYKSCEAYQNSGNTIDKNTCESIIIKEDYKKKCQFNEGSKTCTIIDRKCSDFKVDSIADQCYNNILSSDIQRCSYSNNFCSLTVKPTCLELFNSETATEEICNKAKTSSDKKICSLKSDNSGCDEFNNPTSTSTPTSQGGNVGKYLDIFAFSLFILQCLLI